jgi:hypothetical protein
MFTITSLVLFAAVRANEVFMSAAPKAAHRELEKTEENAVEATGSAGSFFNFFQSAHKVNGDARPVRRGNLRGSSYRK